MVGYFFTLVGHKPVRSQVSAIVDENGNTLSSHDDVCVRWRSHFLMF